MDSRFFCQFISYCRMLYIGLQFMENNTGSASTYMGVETYSHNHLCDNELVHLFIIVTK